MAAATVAGLYPTVLDAQNAMGNGFEKEYKPDAHNAAIYSDLYKKYSQAGGFVQQYTK
jgi:L-ribulokinase